MRFTKQAIALAAAVTLMPALPVTAQEFDLSSQRSEKREVNPVPGHVVDHNGIVINPTPKSMKVEPSGRYAFPSGNAKVKDASGKFTEEIATLVSRPVDLTVEFGPKKAKKAGVESVDGAYSLVVGPKGVTIVGYNERGAFYGLQTLRQIVASEQAAQGSIPYMTIVDSPDLDDRGVVEGFYGTPWSHEVRLSLIDFYGKNKMNTYIYGPKDDPYHSTPNWRKPYPADQEQKIRELVDASKKARVDFVWAIHPGGDLRWTEADYDSLVNKLDMMYQLGVRDYAIFFDDINGEGTNPKKQVEWLNRLTNDFVKKKGDVGPLIMCPTDYSRLWANPDSTGALATYGRLLDPTIEVMYTGDVVCSDLTHDTMNFFDNLIKRPGYYWWNYPVTDYCRNIILQGPVYGLDPTMTSEEVSSFVSNPMEHGEASKLALYGVADYAWNMAGYNPIDNWERGLTELTPKARDAYRTFAIHSADTETGYRRDESWETETFRLADYTPEKAAALREEFKRVAAVPAIMEAECDNQLLMGELRPWLAEFGKLGQRGLTTLDLIDTYRAGNDSLFWNAFIAGVFTPEQRAAWEAHKSGTMKLQPFIDVATNDMLYGFGKRLMGSDPMFFSGVGSFPNLATTQAQLMFDNDTKTFWHSGASQNDNSWYGADLGTVRDVDSIYIRQGRNSVDDVDYFDSCVLQASADGRVWTDLTDPLDKTYDIHWSGKPVKARYVRVKKLPTDKKSWVAVRDFIVNPVSEVRLGFDVDAADQENALLAFDANPATRANLDGGAVSFGLKPGVKRLVMLTDASAQSPVSVVMMTEGGTELTTTSLTTPYATVEVPARAARVFVTGGDRHIYEVIF